MTKERVTAILYLAVFFKTRLKERLRYKMEPEERGRLLRIREGTQDLITACEATLAGNATPENDALIDRLALTTCKVVEPYLEGTGRTMGYRLKAYIRTVREETRTDESSAVT